MNQIHSRVLNLKPSIERLAELRYSLQKILDFDAIDLVVLNDATSILRFEAVSGKRLFCRDRHRCAAFVSLAAREYESDMAMMETSLGKDVQFG